MRIAEVAVLQQERNGLTAAAGPPLVPPREWFEMEEPDTPTGWTVTADGQVYGHAALWGTCHTGKPGRCITPPKSRSDYGYYKTGLTEVEDGELIPTGRITLGTGHASLTASPAATAEHYDNTGAVVADVNVRDGKHGIWVSGALRPDVPPERIRTLRGASLSGDWRSIKGALEMLGLLAVNVPGFPVPRGQALTAAGRQELYADALEANEEILALVAAGTYDLSAVQEISPAAEEISDEEWEGAIEGLQAAAKKGERYMAQRAKVKQVMREFKAGKLKSSTGAKVTSRKQAIAIALSEARMTASAEDLAQVAELAAAAFDESKHPRHPKGSKKGGQFTLKEAQRILDVGVTKRPGESYAAHEKRAKETIAEAEATLENAGVAIDRGKRGAMDPELEAARVAQMRKDLESGNRSAMDILDELSPAQDPSVAQPRLVSDDSRPAPRVPGDLARMGADHYASFDNGDEAWIVTVKPPSGIERDVVYIQEAKTGKLRQATDADFERKARYASAAPEDGVTNFDELTAAAGKKKKDRKIDDDPDAEDKFDELDKPTDQEEPDDSEPDEDVDDEQEPDEPDDDEDDPKGKKKKPKALTAEGEDCGSGKRKKKAMTADADCECEDIPAFDPLSLPAARPAEPKDFGAAIRAASFTEPQRAKLAEKGQAMSDGSFPIRNRGDLRNAIQSVGRAADSDAARRWIIKRARELKAIGDLPATWGITAAAFSESMHPRHPKGSREGGRFAEKRAQIAELESEARYTRDEAKLTPPLGGEQAKVQEHARRIQQQANAAKDELEQLESAKIAFTKVVDAQDGSSTFNVSADGEPIGAVKSQGDQHIAISGATQRGRTRVPNVVGTFGSRQEAADALLMKKRGITAAGTFEEGKHPRHGKGDPKGGQFAPKEGASLLRNARNVPRATDAGALRKRAYNDHFDNAGKPIGPWAALKENEVLDAATRQSGSDKYVKKTFGELPVGSVYRDVHGGLELKLGDTSATNKRRTPIHVPRHYAVYVPRSLRADGQPEEVLAAGTFDETKHPRHGKGDPKGGQFAAKSSVGGKSRTERERELDAQRAASPEAVADRMAKMVREGRDKDPEFKALFKELVRRTGNEEGAAMQLERAMGGMTKPPRKRTVNMTRDFSI